MHEILHEVKEIRQKGKNIILSIDFLKIGKIGTKKEKKLLFNRFREEIFFLEIVMMVIHHHEFV